MTDDTATDDSPAQNGESGATIDSDLKETLTSIPGEDRLTAEASLPDEDAGKSGELEMADAWFPNDEEWQGKTIIHWRQAQGLAAARRLAEVFPEIKPVEDDLIQIIENYEMYLTSIDGRAREQQTGVLKSMFSAAGDLGDGEHVPTWASLFASTGEDDDD